MTKRKNDNPGKFPVIRSARDRAANVHDIRERMAEARKLAKCYSGCGFIEASIQDILAHGGLCFGRNFVLPPCGTGVHDVADPNRHTKDGQVIPKEEREANKRRARRIIGCNGNASATAKAMMAEAFLKAGVRCRLYVAGKYTIVDNWPDYDKCEKVLAENNCGYLVS